MGDPLHKQYKDMLLELENYVQAKDLIAMKFRCNDIIKKKESENVKSVLEFWEALEQRDKLGPMNVEFLEELLKTCMSGRTDGLACLQRYKLVHLNNAPTSIPLQNLHPAFPAPAGAQIIYVQAGAGPIPPSNPTPKRRYEGPDLKREIAFLEKSLGRDWRFFLRSLGLNEDDMNSIEQDHPRNVREAIHQSLWAWLYQEQQNASRQRMIAALRDSSVQRNDLACSLEDGNY